MKTLRVLLLNQCFHPDYVATAQYLTDLAQGLVAAGHKVTVVAASRGYDNPDKRYPVVETWKGIHIRRIWTPGLGKQSKWRRFIDFAIFWLNATFILLRQERQDITICLTSPPLISTLGTAVAALKGGAVIPWVMDLNPDEAVAAGWLKAGGLPERFMSALQGWSFKRSAKIIALDRFMAARLEAKGLPAEMIHVDAPWSHDDAIHYDAAARETFRTQHGLGGKFVVMYSGNHSPCHPLDSLLQSVLYLAKTNHIHFMFIGGGSEFIKVKAFQARHELTNITCLPYLPLDQLSGSLSSADLHVVVMGAPFVGIIHPCKIYNILATGLPFLGIGPPECHLTDLASRISDKRYATMASHNNIPLLTTAIQTAANQGALPPATELQKLAAEFSIVRLRPRLVSLVEQCATP